MKTNRISLVARNSLLLLILFSTSVFAQEKEGFNWIFGYGAWMTWNATQTIDGMSGLPTPLAGAKISQWEGSLSMSDRDGNLMFYSDGVSIWNKNHIVMPNGSGMTGLSDAAQSGIVIPYPGQSNKFILFTIGQAGSNNLAYSVVDMTLDNGLGDIVSGQKNIPLTGQTSVLGENIATVKMSDGSGYWLIAAGRGEPSTINVWKVTSSGVATSCFASSTLPYSIADIDYANHSEAYLRFSPDGKYFALPTLVQNRIFFGEFNSQTGTFPIIKQITGYPCYGLDFNASGKLLYTIEPYNKIIHCYKFADLLASSDPSSMAHYTMTHAGTAYSWPLQLGPDGRLYSTIANTQNMLVIDNIDDYGNSTAHVVSGLIPSGTSGGLGLPTFPSYVFASIENTCSYFTDDIWYFGSGGGGIMFNEDTNGDKVAVSASGESKVASNENSLSVSSPGCGSSLIFYSQHDKLYNAKHELMLNGSFTGHTSVADGLAACYIGNNQYMLFAVNGAYENRTTIPMGLDYHIVDMSGDNGYGEKIASGNIEPSGMAESIELLPVPNTSDQYWLIYRLMSTSTMRVRKITGATIGAPTDYSLSSYEVANALTYSLRANKKCNMLALLYTGVNVAPIVLFNFDVVTGALTYKDKTNPPTPLGGSTYGLEISPNSKYLYVTAYDDATSMITQYDIQNKTWTTPFLYGGRGGGMKIGPDGKLYVKRPGRYMGIIDNPDAPLTAAGYTQNGFDLGNGINSTGLAFSTGLTPPAICPSGLNQAPVAVDDTFTVFINGNPACLPVMANDYDPNPGDSLSLVKVYFLNEADTNLLNVSFNLGDSLICVTPKAAAREGDVVTLIYTIRDDANPIRLCDDAKITINIINYPDNISDADCYIDPPVGVWSFKELYKSVEGVFEMSVPLVGDIDNDGNTEIVCAGTSIVISNFSADTIKIFDAAGKRLKHKFPTERFHAGYGTIAMADVDKDGFAEIFVATTENATAGNQGYIYCYKHDGTFKWKSNVVYTTAVATRSYPYLNITDFNGDSVPEIMANDRIFNAQNGDLLLDCGLIAGGLDYGTGAGHNSYYGTATGSKGAFSSVADMDHDGKPELVAGRNIYKIKINSLTNPSLNSCTILKSVNSSRSDLGDGYTTVADLNLDGYLDVVVVRFSSAAYMYAWDGRTGDLLNSNVISVSSGTYGGSIPFLGDLDGDGIPEIAFSTQYKLNAFKYNKSLGTISQMPWSPLTTNDVSASTTLTLFDFDQDKKMELVYRDTKELRIIDGTTGVTKKSVTCASWTMNEYPVVADVDGDGYANIIVLGKPVEASHGNGFLYVFDSDLSIAGATPWAPARKVWNQWGYNAVNVNEDLTIPAYQLNPATVFPGNDGILGTPDDIRPYNGFLMQQTVLNKNGTPIWLTPDVYSDPSLIKSSVIGDSVSITVGMINQGDAAIGSPVYVTLYKESIAAANKIITDSANIQIMPGNTGYVTVRIADITPFLPMINIVVRINDNGTTFTYQAECDDSNNVITILNPAINLMMRKDATLESIPHNGTYENPVAALFSEIIEYTITAVNANTGIGKVIIRDTLPPYLDFVSSNPVVIPTASGTTPQRDALEWTIAGVASMATTTVTVKATPQAGTSASQPMFINRAWVTVSDTITVPTNSTYHQGASIGIATFSAGFGGNIYNAGEQALDYRTSPRSGIVIVPDEGYRFAGWSHEDYISLRGKTIQAEEGIMHYDTLTVYGDIELHANFELEEYPIEYHLNGSVNAGNNPPAYTIESGAITLGTPEKAGDVFTGWTGSNGEKPQLDVIISGGSTGELEFYANFLRSGKEDETQLDNPEEDKIWAAKDELYIRTSKPGSVVRIYSMEGVLQKQQTILQTGEMKIKLARGIYVVTLNNSIGQTVRID